MELDEFKYYIKSKVPERQEKSAEELNQLLGAKTQSVVGKLKSSLHFEMFCAVFFSLAFSLIAIFTNHAGLRIYFGLFGAMMVGFIFIISYLLKRVGELSKGGLDIKGNLTTLMNLVQEYTKRCFQFTMCLLPVCFLFSFWLGYDKPTHSLPQSQFVLGIFVQTDSSHFVFLTVYFVALAIATYFFTKWYLKKLFGNYVEELKTQIRELT